MYHKPIVEERQLRPLLDILLLRNIPTHNYLYALQQHIHKEHGIKFSSSSIGGALNKMESHYHLLTSEYVESPIKPHHYRRVYTLTTKGKLVLENLLRIVKNL